MKKVLEFLTLHKHAVIWTICYAFVLYMVLYCLFGFDLLVAKNWARLTHVELYSFPEIVFGMLVLAAIPLYIATTVVIVRNKECLFKFPKPNCLKPVEPVKEETKEESHVQNQEQEVIEMPSRMPREMREGFIRAHNNMRMRQYSVFNKPVKESEEIADEQKNEEIINEIESEKAPAEPVKSKVKVPEVITQKKRVMPKSVKVETAPIVKDMESALPLPESFEIDDETSVGEVHVPTFSDIKFYDDEEDDDKKTTPENADEKDGVTTENESDEYTDYFHDLGVTVERKDGLYLTDKFAIAVHDDDDFWVADEIDWFAPGKQKPSPITALLNAKKEQGLKPVLYLGCENIMDLDKLLPEWKKSGIKVVKKLPELSKLFVKPKK